MCDSLKIGNYITFNYEDEREVYSQKAIVVDKYLFENEIPRIEIGCNMSGISNKEVYVLEAESFERFVIMKENLLDYELISETVYRRLNYTRLKHGTKVKLYDNVYGIEKIPENLIDNIGTILMIYTNENGIKIAVLSIDRKSENFEIPLVNCIAL